MKVKCFLIGHEIGRGVFTDNDYCDRCALHEYYDERQFMFTLPTIWRWLKYNAVRFWRDYIAMEWISVKDKLPANNIWCIASGIVSGKQIVITEMYLSVHGAFYFHNGYKMQITNLEVTHWMPLPEPPNP